MHPNILYEGMQVLIPYILGLLFHRFLVIPLLFLIFQSFYKESVELYLFFYLLYFHIYRYYIHN